MLTVAIVGRPNVGKSTLFNRLTGRRQALVSHIPGTTRDRREGIAEIGDVVFKIIDTAGLEVRNRKSETRNQKELTEAMMEQTGKAIEDADLVWLVIDAREGVTEQDKLFARQIRKTGKPVRLVANKTEGKVAAANFAESYALGLGEPIPIAAEHAMGIHLLMETIGDQRLAVSDQEEEKESVRIVIAGRPNVGKSTLVNQIIGEERVITGAMPGMTRDAVEVPFEFAGTPMVLVDTAGLRKRAAVIETVEKMSTSATIQAIRFAHVVILVLDAEEALEKQDLTIADHVEQEGRSLVIAVNKWDKVEEQQAYLHAFHARLEHKLAQMKGVPVVTISALAGKNIDKMLQAALDVYGRWNQRIPTSVLNNWLEQATTQHPPPLERSKRIKLRYVTQDKARPPTFVFFTNLIPPRDYQRYLAASLRHRFDFAGVPVRLVFRKGRNPYA